MTLEFEDNATLTPDALENGTAFAPRFDANGLVTAVAIEAGTRDVLMLAHMNAEALSLTLETGEVHYYSRSRGKVWKKGETSGEIQKLVAMRVDCDQDAILVTVEQTGRGAACHTGHKGCFYRRVVTEAGAVRLEGGMEPQVFDPRDVYSSGS